MSDTYSDVDAALDVAAAVAWQDRVDAWPQIHAYKRRTYDLMPASGVMLDVGSGTGHDLVGLKRPAVGVDASMAMCRTARARACDVARASAVTLPFRARALGAARADRVFEHLAEPEAALAEMVRVVASGGRIVVADPDQGTLVIAVPDVRPDLVNTVRRLRRDRGYRNGTIVRSMPAMFVAAGLTDITVDAFPLVLTDVDEAFGLPTWVDHWRSEFSGADAAEWEAGMQRARAGAPFHYALLYFVVSGTVP